MALGRRGSIAVVERFIRTPKQECVRQVVVPVGLDAMRDEVGCFVTWYNTFRPHFRFPGRTPQEVHDGVDAPPMLAVVPNSKTPALGVRVSFFEGRRHLPVIEMRKAA